MVLAVHWAAQKVVPLLLKIKTHAARVGVYEELLEYLTGKTPQELCLELANSFKVVSSGQLKKARIRLIKHAEAGPSKGFANGAEKYKVKWTDEQKNNPRWGYVLQDSGLVLVATPGRLSVRERGAAVQTKKLLRVKRLHTFGETESGTQDGLPFSVVGLVQLSKTVRNTGLQRNLNAMLKWLSTRTDKQMASLRQSFFKHRRGSTEKDAHLHMGGMVAGLLRGSRVRAQDFRR